MKHTFAEHKKLFTNTKGHRNYKDTVTNKKIYINLDTLAVPSDFSIYDKQI